MNKNKKTNLHLGITEFNGKQVRCWRMKLFPVVCCVCPLASCNSVPIPINQAKSDFFRRSHRGQCLTAMKVSRDQYKEGKEVTFLTKGSGEGYTCFQESWPTFSEVRSISQGRASRKFFVSL